jgi:hypothetical protein
VREVARQREQAVVRLRVRADRARAERGDEPLDERDARRRGGVRRSQKPRGRVEEVGARAGGAAGHAAGHRVARDEAGIRNGCERALRRGDVGHDDVLAHGAEHLLHDGRSRADRNRNDDELGMRDRLGERRRRLDRASRRGLLEHRAVGVEAATAGARAAGSERDGRPDEPGADDRDPLDRARPLDHALR